MKIYVASSWKNMMQQGVVHTLRAAGHEVYDFKNPAPSDKGFSWSEIDPNWNSQDVKKSWSNQDYIEALAHPIAQRGFKNDMTALRECDACVLVLPCGKSAHLELGWAAGAGKKTVVLLEADCENITGHPEYVGVKWMAMEAELMYLMNDYITDNLSDVLAFLERTEKPAEPVLAEDR